MHFLRLTFSDWYLVTAGSLKFRLCQFIQTFSILDDNLLVSKLRQKDMLLINLNWFSSLEQWAEITMYSREQTLWVQMLNFYPFPELDAAVFRFVIDVGTLASNCKLQPAFMAQARRARAINRRGKLRVRNLQYGPRHKVSKILAHYLRNIIGL